jgi:hypothetical protein
MNHLKPPHYAIAPQKLARMWLDGDFEGMAVTDVAAVHRINLPSLTNAIKREREKRILEEVCV